MYEQRWAAQGGCDPAGAGCVPVPSGKHVAGSSKNKLVLFPELEEENSIFPCFQGRRGGERGAVEGWRSRLGWSTSPVAACEWHRLLLPRSIAGRFQPATESAGRMAAVLVPPGLDAKREAVHLQHEVYGEVPWRLRRTKWCRPRCRRSSVRVEDDMDPIAFSIC